MAVLRSVKALKRFSIAALDDELGRVHDVLFDGQSWTIRYLVVETGGWLLGRQVLVSPISIQGIEWEQEVVRVALTREQVENSPAVDAAKPVSRQRESEFHQYYGYADYWSGPYLWGHATLPSMVSPLPLDAEAYAALEQRREQERAQQDPDLRSAREVSGYDIQASDGALGHVEDFLFAEDSWKLGLMVIDTRNWWPGKHVLVAPQRIAQISWASGSVMLDASRAQIESSPEYDPDLDVTTESVRDLSHSSRHIS